MSRQSEHHGPPLPQGDKLHDVVIIGAGVAGLAALKTLHRDALDDVIVLEATDRIGGRVYSAPVPDDVTLHIDMGPSWIHYEHVNPLRQLLTGADMATTKTNYHDFTARDAAGGDVTEEQEGALRRLEDTMGRGLGACARVPLTVSAALREAGWRAQSPADWTALTFQVDWMYGIGADKLSKYWSDECTPATTVNDDLRVTDRRGYAALLDQILTTDTGNKNSNNCGNTDDVITCACNGTTEHEDTGNTLRDRIILNSPVTSVAQAEGEPVTVTSQSGVTYRAHCVILTASVGVLLRDDVTFSPPLTSQKLASIRKLSMCNYMKIVLEFPRRFWDDTEFILYVTSQPARLQVWENLAWTGRPVLMVTALGALADRLGALRDAEVEEEVLRMLRVMYPGQQVPAPRWLLRRDWSRAAHFWGAYSVRPAGFSMADLEQLRAPHGDLHFAGEVYSSYFYGEVLGAYETGEAAAHAALLTCKQRRQK